MFDTPSDTSLNPDLDFEILAVDCRTPEQLAYDHEMYALRVQLEARHHLLEG
jgi:hypothetical protein